MVLGRPRFGRPGSGRVLEDRDHERAGIMEGQDQEGIMERPLLYSLNTDARTPT